MTVPVKLVATVVTVTVPAEPRLMVTDRALKVVATVPTVMASVAVWLGAAVGIAAEVPETESE